MPSLAVSENAFNNDEDLKKSHSDHRLSSHQDYLKELAFLQEIKELLRHAQHNPDEFIQLKAVVKLTEHLSHDIVILSSHSVLMMQLCKALRMLVMGNGFHKDLKQASLKAYFILVNAILTIKDISEYESREVLSGLTEIALYGREKFQEKSLGTLLSLWKKVGLKECLRIELIQLLNESALVRSCLFESKRIGFRCYFFNHKK